MATPKKKNNVWNWVFIAASLILLFAYIVWQEGWDNLIYIISVIDYKWLLAAFLSMFLSYIVETFVLMVARARYQDRSLFTFGHQFRDILTAVMLGAITPFQAGNVGTLVARMDQDGMEAGDASTVALIKNIDYVGCFVVLVGILLAGFSRYFEISTLLWIVIAGCFLFNFFYLFLMFFIGRASRPLTAIALWCVRLGVKLHIVKDQAATEEVCRTQILKLKENMGKIKLRKSDIFLMLLLGVIQQWFIYQVSFFVALSLGIHQPYFHVLTAQAACTMIQNSMPIPGGLGLADLAFNSIMGPIMGTYISISMLLWRLVTFYFPIILGIVSTALGRRKPTNTSTNSPTNSPETELE